MPPNPASHPVGAAPARKDVVADLDAQYVRSFVDRWDDLIDWDKREAAEGGFFADLLRGAGARRVLDAAAGTGFHSVSLIKAGFDVTTVDGSAEMLRRASANGERRGIPLRAVCSDWRAMADRVGDGFDAVVCLGSSFPHLFGAEDRSAALASFRAALKPGGLLIVDHRNFDAIRAHRYRSSGRYYYCGKGVEVSIDHIDPNLCRFRYDFPDDASYTLEVYPILSGELTDLLSGGGFSDASTYGDFKTDFDPYETDFIIHTARRC